MSAPAMRPLGRVGVIGGAYLLAFGAALAWFVGAGAGGIALCVAPAVVIAVLAFTSQADRRQYVARLFAATLFLPALLLMWATSGERVDLWLLLFALVHALVLIALTLWLAQYATRIDASPGMAPVSGDVLRRRLASLASVRTGFSVARGEGSDEWIVDLHPPDGNERTHRIVLDIDERGRSVGVREFLGAAGAAPETAAERSMRGPADPPFDPSRPSAQAVWARTWQSTMIEPQRLADAAVEFDADRVITAGDGGKPIDGEALVTLLAAVATSSGFAWQPRLFGRRTAGAAATGS